MVSRLPDSAGPKSPRVVVGVCGGIAAYKSVELCRLLMKWGARVSPILTQSATRFVGEATFAAVCSDPPRTSLWDSPEPSPHTTLGQNADAIVVAPATARLIGSYANGLSDDLLSTTLLATRAPIVIAPAMHTEMWENAAVQENVAKLRSRGVVIVDPEDGELAGGDVGVGRLAPIDRIFTAVAELGAVSHRDGGSVHQVRRDLEGKTVLITAGGTREAIDPVRFIGNRSSGKQGYAIAAEAHARGAKVVLVSSAGGDVPYGIEVVDVESAQDMYDAVMHHLADADVVIMAAAVADFRPARTADQKIKKAAGLPELQLEPTVDILAAISSKRRPDQVIVGFAAETEDLEANAADKLKAKRLDIIVANDVSSPGAGFGHVTNEALILDKTGRKTSTGLVEKRTVAATLFDRILEMNQ